MVFFSIEHSRLFSIHRQSHGGHMNNVIEHSRMIQERHMVFSQ